MEFPGRRAPTVEACRTGYDPSGNNPPNGPIMPPNVPSYTTVPSSYEGAAGAPVDSRALRPDDG